MFFRANFYQTLWGITIDVSKVSYNNGIFSIAETFKIYFSGLRYIAKLLLNSLWGKFAQKNIQIQTKIFKSTDIGAWISLICDKSLIISQIIPINQDIVNVKYKKSREFVKENSNSNTVIAVSFYFLERY